jgi:hypothetical protein
MENHHFWAIYTMAMLNNHRVPVDPMEYPSYMPIVAGLSSFSLQLPRLSLRFPHFSMVIFHFATL